MHNSGLVLDSHNINGLAHSNNFDNKQNAGFRGRQIGRAVVTGRVANDAKGIRFSAELELRDKVPRYREKGHRIPRWIAIDGV